MHYKPGSQLDARTIDELSRLEHRAERAALRTAPLTRILFWLAIVIGAELALILAALTQSLTVGLYALVPCILVGLAITPWIAIRLPARRAYTDAWRVAWSDDGHLGHGAVARIKHATDSDPYTVVGVAAWPLGGGAGTAVMRDLLRHTDAAGVELELQASSRRVAHFYQRLGFHPTANHRSLRGGYPMLRPAPIPTCNESPNLYGGATEHTPSVSAGYTHPATPQTPHQP
ncbi:hypothetical protein [Luteococcus sp.]|uniref:hypothetical protein n=1 Tax=Luteococcus sp. TaxID=1969402 RepID=UPI003735110A